VLIHKNVEFKLDNGIARVKGPKGELSSPISNDMIVEEKDAKVEVKRPSDSIRHRSLHGLTRTLIYNMVKGVTEGFSRSLDIVGVGYKAERKGSGLLLVLGYSHPIYFVPPKGITVETPAPTKITVSGIDKVLVGQVAAKIRSFRPPEPYKGKGIRYEDEHVRRKAGKTAG
jgi:large subunit ribosomal protein L6